MLQMRILSSLHRVFPGKCPEADVRHLSAAANEPLNFQAAFKLKGPEPGVQIVNVRTETELPLSTYLVGYVPVLHTAIPDLVQEDFPLPAPGLFPDMLLKKTTNPELAEEGAPWGKKFYEKDEDQLLNAVNDSWQSVWFVMNEDQKELKPGKYPVRVRFEAADDPSDFVQEELEVEIVPASLIHQKLMYTNWFHCDCLADYYRVEIFSDEFFRIFRNYARTAAANGMNMMLTPAFTPPLDTPIDRERMTAQLVGITRENGVWSFDFSLLKKFIDISREEGIEYFEHSHLFSQWGAKAAPKIMATVDGEYRRVFGWDTDAAGPEYHEFLHAYLPAVTSFLKKEGLEKKTLFHISDEPSEGMEESYAAARAAVGDLLDGFMVGDALSHYRYYEQGLVKVPICVTSTIDEFLGRCDDLWAYYTGGQHQGGLSNRIMVLPPEQNRVLGLELYAHNIKGFLQWGYNYYYNMLSHGLYDPKMDPGGYYANAGSCYCVYPGRNGEAIQSISQKAFFEGINDMRALQTLEQLRGRAVCDAILEKHWGKVDFRVKAGSPEKLLAFREDVNRALAGEN